MHQEKDTVKIEIKELNGYCTVHFKTKYESKKDHGGKIHDCHPFESCEDTKRRIFGVHTLNCIEGEKTHE
jgi:hypothetical protein